MWALARAVVRSSSSSSSFLTMPYTSTRTTRCTQSRRETMLLQFPPYPWNRTITIHRCARNLASSPPRSTTTTATATATTKATTPTVTRKSTTTAAAVGFATVVTSVMAMAALAWPESDTIGTDASTTRVGITIPTATSTATATPDNVRLQFQLPLRLGSNDAPANVHTSNLHEEGRSVDSDLDSNSNLDSSSPYSFPFYDLLLQQLEVVIYVEGRNAATITSDSGRNKPSGLVGLACLHCIGVGGATLRTLPPDASIFPQDRRSLARDVSTKMYHHVSNCHNFPGPIREHLRELRREHNNNTKQQERERERAQAKVKHTANQPSRSSTTPRKHPFVSQEERLFFKDLWYQMGHK